MNFIDFIEILVPIGLSLTNLEAIELGASLLIVLEFIHQFLRSPGYEKVGYPKDVSIHIAVFAIVQQIESKVQHFLSISPSAKKREVTLGEVFIVFRLHANALHCPFLSAGTKFDGAYINREIYQETVAVQLLGSLLQLGKQ